MIIHESCYRLWLEKRGVGARDRGPTSRSRSSYVSYLRVVPRYLGLEISPRTLAAESDVLRIMMDLRGRVEDKTINNCRAAMRQYVAMVEAGAHL